MLRHCVDVMCLLCHFITPQQIIFSYSCFIVKYLNTVCFSFFIFVLPYFICFYLLTYNIDHGYQYSDWLISAKALLALMKNTNHSAHSVFPLLDRSKLDDFTIKTSFSQSHI